MKNSIFIVALLVAGTFVVPAQVGATGLSNAIELEGFAWSSTIGWISMNCSNTDTCIGGSAPGTKVDYNVQIETDGSMTGYAWSPNIGWIKFDPAGPYPTGSATKNQSATAFGTYPNLTLEGWARACAGAANQATCSGGVAASAGGWDGWISLAGDATDGSSYGVVIQNTVATDDSFAWGGVFNVGWIDFAANGPIGNPIPPVSIPTIPNITTSDVTYTQGTPDASGNYSITFSPIISGIPVGETVKWTLSVGTFTDDGEVTGTTGAPSFDSIPTLSNIPFDSTDPIVFEIDTDDDVAETDETDNVFNKPLSLVYPPPTITITGPEVVRAGEPVDITWEITAPYTLTTCTVRGPGVNVPSVNVNGAIGSPGTDSDTESSSALTNAARFEVSCTVGPNTYTETYRVEVIPTFQEV